MVEEESQAMENPEEPPVSEETTAEAAEPVVEAKQEPRAEAKPARAKSGAKKASSPRARKSPKKEQLVYWGTGRRKTSVARVRLVPGDGKFSINGRTLEEYFGVDTMRSAIRRPLEITENLNRFDVIVTVLGGGVSGQAGAVQHGISRALLQVDETLRPRLKRESLLTRDPREKERRKYGLKKARKRPQFSKR